MVRAATEDRRAGQAAQPLPGVGEPAGLAEGLALREAEHLPRADLEREPLVRVGAPDATLDEPEAEEVGVALSRNASTSRPSRSASRTGMASPSTTTSRPSQSLQPVVTTTLTLPPARFLAFCCRGSGDEVQCLIDPDTSDGGHVRAPVGAHRGQPVRGRGREEDRGQSSKVSRWHLRC